MWIDVPSTGARTRIKHRLINCSLVNFLEKEEERWKERKEEKKEERKKSQHFHQLAKVSCLRAARAVIV